MTKIEWTDETWNPVTGCTKVSQGCKHCYAERMATRLRGRHGYPAEDPFRVTLRPERLTEPLRWKKPRRVFVCSMSDLFHEDVPDQFIDQVFAVMVLRPDCTFQVLTKRPERMKSYMAAVYGRKRRLCDAAAYKMELGVLAGTVIARALGEGSIPNVWLGTSVENQATADERIPHLLQTPAAVRFLSCEPLLGSIDLAYSCFNGADSFGTMPGIHWVIVGGESGPGARPIGTEWVRSLRNQCQSARVPFFFKQWGGVCKELGRDLDGRTWDEFPTIAAGA